MVRCLSLADALAEEGWACRFACRAGTRDIVPVMARSCHAYRELGPEEWDSTDALRRLVSGQCDLLVVDHHRLDAAYERQCRTWAGRVLAIEDLEDRRHDCDVLVDATPGLAADAYRERSAPGTRLLLGPEYALLRDTFVDRRQAALARRRAGGAVARVFIGFGAVDGKNMTPVALKGVREAGLDVPVDVVLGPGARGIDDVHAVASALGLDVAVHVDPPDVASIMADADLAIGAAGSGAWERCCLGLPSIVVVTAANQEATAKALDRAHAGIVAGRWGDVGPRDIAVHIRALSGEDDRRRRMAENAAALCDGEGKRRIVAAL